ncbi:probable LRR receptor-like serine threonine-kinase At3g47570, partial [Olea europaea subsp. europaea]
LLLFNFSSNSTRPSYILQSEVYMHPDFYTLVNYLSFWVKMRDFGKENSSIFISVSSMVKLEIMNIPVISMDISSKLGLDMCFPKWDNNNKGHETVPKGRNEWLKGKEEGASKTVPKVESQPSRSKDIKCFRYLGSGHIASQCPNKRAMVLLDNGEVVSKSEGDYDHMLTLEEEFENIFPEDIPSRLPLSTRQTSYLKSLFQTNRLTRVIPMRQRSFKSKVAHNLLEMQIQLTFQEDTIKFWYLQGNSLRGSIPNSLFNISRLRKLVLNQDYFSGSLPSSIGNNMPNLEVLYLDLNNLTGLSPTLSQILQRVAELNLSNMGLTGSIPPQLGNLSFLIYLDLSGNSFHGELPGELAHLHRLKFLDFSVNNFSGGIPSSLGLEILNMDFNFLQEQIPLDIGNLGSLKILRMKSNRISGFLPRSISQISSLEIMNLEKNFLSGNIPEDMCHNVTKLRFLSLASNSLNGPIPLDISECTELQVLTLQSNNLTGLIPREIGNLTMLKVLYLDYNILEGFIPRELGYLHGLEELFLPSNSLRGSIPDSLFNMSRLRKLGLAKNTLSGSLPSSIGNNMPNLEVLYLDLNNLTGVIPNSFSNSSNLSDLDLAGNQLTGLIPNSLGNLRFLQSLTLHHNNLEADQELSFITSLTRCKYLREISVGANPINGILPESIGNISNLDFFEASECELKGGIPKQISNLSNLILLSLSNNELSGFIPYEFNGLQQLQGLYCHLNSIGGILPTSLCHLPNLYLLSLARNKILGALPECLGNVTSLRQLFLGFNKLTSSIPASLWNLKDILYFYLSSNLLNGSLPPEVARLQAVIELDLSKNQFSGHIPSTIIQLPNLINLSLADNKFEGSIPHSMGKLISLENLDLSNNSLTGMIPRSLEALQHLMYFNVSFNKLSGEIPSGGPFENFTYLSFLSNEAICGKPQFHVPPCRGSSLPRSKNKKVVLAVLIPITTALAAATLVIVLLWLRYQRRQVQAQADSIPDKMLQRISFYQLQQATDGFNDRNLLGRGSFGSVFKGSLTDGTIVAIKVFHLQLEGAFKSFEIECEVLKNLRHRNLTKVISSCSNLDFKALVLEYMANGSLEEWLHSDGHSLDIIQRSNIMTDVAHAIEYLHHSYSTPVVHCDLKPSNVLLDQDLVGHVSDFGIAKLLGEEETIRHTTTLGTFGYMAPEYGAEGIVTMRCDVYSYGIMLMETFTSRRPTDEMFSEGLSLRNWVANSNPHAIDQVVDASILSTEEQHISEKLECISSIMNMAVNCTAESPENRPSMKDVVASLEKIKKFLRIRMSKREDSNLSLNGNHINVFNDVMRRVEKLLSEMGDRLARLDMSVANLSKGQRTKVSMLGVGYLGSEYITSQCPNKRAMVLRDNGEVASKSEGDYDHMLALEEEFEDIFPEDIPSRLPSIRGIEHQIDFIPIAIIPNCTSYLACLLLYQFILNLRIKICILNFTCLNMSNTIVLNIELLTISSKCKFNLLSRRIPSSFGLLTKLQQLYLAENAFIGAILLSLLCTQLQILALQNNKLIGTIPRELGNSTTLELLYPSFNNLERHDVQASSCSLACWGTSHNLPLPRCSKLIPHSISNSSKVTLLDLSSNQFTSLIPNTLGNLRFLQSLSLGVNNLKADQELSFISSLIGCGYLRELSVGLNPLNGILLASTGNISNVDFFEATYCGFKVELDGLHSNRIVGRLPQCLGNATSLRKIHLNFNQLTSSMAASLWNLKDILYFNLTSKLLNGSLPPEVANLDDVIVLDLSTNQFSSYILNTITLIFAIMLVLRYPSRQGRPQTDSLPNITLERILYYQLKRATDWFSDRKLLGKGSFGSIFKGSFADGTLFAVKVFHLQMDRAFKSFVAECAVLRSLRRRNLTKVIGSCSNNDFKALILEYMPNGSLEKVDLF